MKFSFVKIIIVLVFCYILFISALIVLDNKQKFYDSFNLFFLPSKNFRVTRL